MNLTENLLNLFRLEAQVRGLRGRLDSAERYVAAQTGRLEDLHLQLEELQTRKRQIQVKIGTLEGESAAIDERLEKLRNELNNSSTNKQYTAVLTELNTVKLNRVEIDDRILQEMEQAERVNSQLEELAGQIAEREKVKAAAEEELRQRHEDVGDRLSELEGEREAAAAQISPTELRVFNELAEAYDGEAMARIEEIDRRNREYACGACNMHMPFEAVAALMGATDSIVCCTACGRILYLQEETRGALAKK